MEATRKLKTKQMRWRVVDPPMLRESGLFLCVRISNCVRSYCTFHLTSKWIIQGASVKPVKISERFHANTMNPSKSSGFFFYVPPGSTFINSTFCPQKLCIFCIDLKTNDNYFPTQHQLIGFCYREGTVYCAVRNGSLYIILRSSHTVYLCVLCGSENKQRLFPYTALTDWFL